MARTENLLFSIFLVGGKKRPINDKVKGHGSQEPEN